MTALKKIYICGTNLSGKSLLLWLLDGHSEVGIFPFHKFGISGVLDAFSSFIANGKYEYRKIELLHDENYTLNIYLQSSNRQYRISIGELLAFLFRSNDCLTSLIHSSITKECTGFSGDNISVTRRFDFSFTEFVDNLISRLKNESANVLTPENIDDIVYESYLASVGNYKEQQSLRYYVQYGHNGPEQIRNLCGFYSEFKVVLVDRDPIQRLYSNSKRVLSKEKTPSPEEIFHVMVASLDGQRKKLIPLERVIGQYRDHEQFKVIRFDDLVYNTSEVMKGIASFLELNFQPSLTVPTIMGSAIQDANFWSNKINDDPYSIYSKKQIAQIEDLYHKPNQLKYFMARVGAKLNS